MPVIFTATFPIRVNGDGTVDILSKLKEEVKKCGCIDIASVSKQLNVDLDKAQAASRDLANKGEIACDPEGLYCCTDEGRLARFIDSINRLRGT